MSDKVKFFHVSFDSYANDCDGYFETANSYNLTAYNQLACLPFYLQINGISLIHAELIYCVCRPGRRSVYFANARASAFLQLTFCEATKLSTVTAMALSISWELQYSLSLILEKASESRIMASRCRTWW